MACSSPPFTSSSGPGGGASVRRSGPSGSTDGLAQVGARIRRPGAWIWQAAATAHRSGELQPWWRVNGLGGPMDELDGLVHMFSFFLFY